MSAAEILIVVGVWSVMLERGPCVRTPGARLRGGAAGVGPRAGAASADDPARRASRERSCVGSMSRQRPRVDVVVTP